MGRPINGQANRLTPTQTVEPPNPIRHRLQVEYVNGDPSTTWGALRAERGHPKPYGISYWSVGWMGCILIGCACLLLRRVPREVCRSRRFVSCARYLGNEINQQIRFRDYPNNLTSSYPPNIAEYASMLKEMVPPLLAKSPSVPLKFFIVSGGPDWDHVWASEVGKNVYAASNHKGYYNQPVEDGWAWNERTVTDCAKRPQREFVPILTDMRKFLDTDVKVRVRVKARVHI